MCKVCVENRKAWHCLADAGRACRRALHSAKHSDVNKATDTMAESSLLEALAPEVLLDLHWR